MKRTAEELEEDLRYMKDPTLWPWLYLPIKRSTENHQTEVGILAGDGPTVYLINMYDSSLDRKPFSDFPKIDYETFEKIQEDGWVVD